MKYQENYRNKRKINRLTTALLGMFFYVLLVLVLKTIQNGFTVGSMAMTIFNLVEFVVISFYLILYTWYSFRNASLESKTSFWKYILIFMLPLAVMTVITMIITQVGSGGDFTSVWNKMTFIVAPTLFCYIPYGILMKMVPVMPMALFMVLCLAYMVLMQFIGYILGVPSRKFTLEREQRRFELEQEVLQQQDEMARRAYEARVKREMLRKAQSQNAQMVQEIQKKHQAGFNENDPLGDIESTPVVETEAFSMITEEMIREAISKQKIRTTQQKIDELKQRQKKEIEKTETVQEKEKPFAAPMNTNAIDELEVEELERMTRNLQKELAAVRERMKEKEE